MNKFLAVIFSLFLFSHIAKSATSYKDFIIVDEVIWALTTDGSIQLIDTKTRTYRTDKVKNDSEILVLVNDNLNNVVIADKARTVKRYNKQQRTWELVGTYTDTIFGLVFDKKNQCYLITDKEIRKAEGGNVYFTNKSINNSFSFKDSWHAITSYHMDMTDRIWLGFDYGEWGGNLLLFDTKTNQFIAPAYTSANINLHGVRSIFDDSASVYVSSGVNHLFMTSGSIIRFDVDQPVTIFSSKSHWGKPIKANQINPSKVVELQSMIPGEYIGPATYHRQTNSIYFYSQHGFFKGKVDSDLSAIDKWTFLTKPKLQWTAGQQYAAGSPMNVLKIIAVGNDQLYFLSQNDGIGCINGKNIYRLP